MYISDFTNYHDLNLLFGRSKMVETARILREAGLIPKGRKDITYKQGALFLFLLCAGNFPSDIKRILNSNTPLTNKYGEDFLQVFSEVFHFPANIKPIKSIHISENYAKIEKKTGSREFGQKHNKLNHITIIEKPLLYKLHLGLSNPGLRNMGPENTDVWK